MRPFKFNIDGETWKVLLLKEEQYNSMVGDDSEAEVDPNQRAIVFNLR